MFIFVFKNLRVNLNGWKTTQTKTILRVNRKTTITKELFAKKVLENQIPVLRFRFKFLPKNFKKRDQQTAHPMSCTIN